MRKIQLERSLSVILVLQNAQSQLTAVEQMVELIGELTSQFEVLLVDNASTDATPEVVDRLARRYPQINSMRSPYPLEFTDLVNRGLAMTSSEIIFVHNGYGLIDANDIDSLWRLRNDTDIVFARPDARLGHPFSHVDVESLIFNSAISPSTQAPFELRHGFCMLRRSNLDRRHQPLTTRGNRVRLRQEMTGPLLSSLDQRRFFSQLQQAMLTTTM